MHASQFIEADRPSDAEVEAAARELDGWGKLHGWWSDSATRDPIGQEEFEGIVERILMSAAAARRGVTPDTL